jgi:penicillin-binding protein 1B
MARKPRSRKDSDAASVRTRHLWLKLAAVVLVLALVGLAWMDAFVRERFAGHEWQLPARVFAQPVDLYQGRELARDDLRRLLELMRYQERTGAPEPGTYAFSGTRVQLHTRGFGESDGEPARKLRFRLTDGTLGSLETASGASVDIARLAPLQIGSIHPGHREDRVLVKLEDVPDTLVRTLLAVEDRRFREHWGLSLRGIARAFVANIKAGGIVEGGSTLTQQLVKNFWLTRERSIARKLIEMPMAMLLELHYSKDAILEAYLNQVYLGQDGSRAIHGMGLGAQFYFGRSLDELEPRHYALLVGLLKGPGQYNPRRNPQAARQRRNTVLRVARDQGVISAAEFKQQRRQDLGVVPRGESALYAFPAFVDLVRRQLAQQYSPGELGGEGLRIQTTLDVLAQIAAESALRSFFEQSDRAKSFNGAVVMTAPESGNVQALVGDKRTRRAGFNRALDARRSVGSLIKPAVVLTALEKPDRYHLGTRVRDEPVEVQLDNGRTWAPENYDLESMGPMPMLDALTQSRNQAMARLGLDLGVSSVVDTLQRLGVNRDLKPYPSLGGVEMTPFEVAAWYQTLAGDGFHTPLRAITEVRNRAGERVARYPVSTRAAVDAGPAFVMQWALQQVVQQGTGRYAAEQLPGLKAAGKTGTSDSFRDAWFAGFSGNRLAVVWLGRDDNGAIGLTGSSGALPVWTDLMQRLPQRPLNLQPPESVEWVWLDEDGDRLSASGCPGARRYPLLRASMPDQATACGKAGEVGEGVMEWFKGWFD